MSNIKDFFYFNRKTILIIIILITLYFFSFYISDTEKKEENVLTEEKYFSVDIKGEIKTPGVYKLQEGKRVGDAIEASGGLLESADISLINLSEKVIDEMLIFIPKKIVEIVENNIETPVKDNIIAQVSKISINTGTINELMKINGIGKVKAQSIVDYRLKNGRFNKLEDLLKVKGIGKATFDKIKDNIKL